MNNFLKQLKLAASEVFMVIDSEYDKDVVIGSLDRLKSLIINEKERLLKESK